MENEAMPVWRIREQSGKVSILKEPNSCKRGQNPRKLLLGKLLSLCKLRLCDRVLYKTSSTELNTKFPCLGIRFAVYLDVVAGVIGKSLMG